MIIMDLHLHSNFSDGKNSIEEMVIQSIECGYTHIAFTDHVWETSDWLDEYIEKINRMKKKYNSYINIYSGVEAKVIDQKGNIDFSKKYYDKFDLVLAAFHRIPLGNNQYIRSSEIKKDFNKALLNWMTSMLNVIENPVVNIIAHPTSVFGELNTQINMDILNEIIVHVQKHNKIFEINLKRNVPSKRFSKLIRDKKLLVSIGSDSHSVEEIKKYSNDIKKINRDIKDHENILYNNVFSSAKLKF